MKECRHSFHRDLPACKVWAYNGTVPGPTIEAERGQALTVTWHDDLPAKPLFPFQGNAYLPGYCGNLPPVRTVVHLHGGLEPMDHFLGRRP